MPMTSYSRYVLASVSLIAINLSVSRANADQADLLFDASAAGDLPKVKALLGLRRAT